VVATVGVLSRALKYQTAQHGPVREGQDPHRRCLGIRPACGLLGSVENGDRLSPWAAGSASVGKESGQQGHVLEELDLRMPFMGEPLPRPSP